MALPERFFIELPPEKKGDPKTTVFIHFFERIYDWRTFPVFVQVGDRYIDSGQFIECWVDSGEEHQIDPNDPPEKTMMTRFKLTSPSNKPNGVMNLYTDALQSGRIERSGNNVKITIVEYRLLMNLDTFEGNRWEVFEGPVPLKDIILRAMRNWRRA